MGRGGWPAGSPRHPAKPRAAGAGTLLPCLLAILIILSMVAALAVGSAGLGPVKVARILGRAIPGLGAFLPGRVDPVDSQIVIALRLPRVLLSILTGMALGMAGALFQGIFRNPMADPYVLGTSSGAALGATLAYAAGLKAGVPGLSAVSCAAFLGAVIAMALVYGLAGVERNVRPQSLLLSGIAVSYALSALTALIMILRKEEMYRIMLWLMGGFANSRWPHVAAIIPYVLAGAAAAMAMARDLDAVLLGEERARQLGVDTGRLQLRLGVTAGLLVAAAVSVSGAIGFVGLIAPHLVRFMTGPRHRVLLPSAALAGGLMLLLSDLAARTLLSPLEIPVGIITSMLGAPFFLYLLRRKG